MNFPTINLLTPDNLILILIAIFIVLYYFSRKDRLPPSPETEKLIKEPPPKSIIKIENGRNAIYCSKCGNKKDIEVDRGIFVEEGKSKNYTCSACVEKENVMIKAVRKKGKVELK